MTSAVLAPAAMRCLTATALPRLIARRSGVAPSYSSTSRAARAEEEEERIKEEDERLEETKQAFIRWPQREAVLLRRPAAGGQQRVVAVVVVW